MTKNCCLSPACQASFNSLPSRERTDPEERISRQFLLHFWLPKSGKKTKPSFINNDSCYFFFGEDCLFLNDQKSPAVIGVCSII